MTEQLWATQATMAPQLETRHLEVDSPPLESTGRPTDVARAVKKDAAAKPVRIGAVSYLNSKPLVEDLDSLLPEAAVGLDYPSRLADDLAAGAIDIGLIPSVEAFRDPEYEIISDACVATRGPVHSVKLYSRVDPGFIRTLALDEGSRTSATLARIMLEERFGVDPERRPLPLGSRIADCDADALVVIGDRAMKPPHESFNTVWDLGEEWAEWTGLPFVFAMWVGRAGAGSDHVAAGLARSRDLGLDRISAIATREAKLLDIPIETADTYLRQNLHFRLGPAERAGLKLFQELAMGQGLAPEGVDLVFRD